jgi:hypothetical protein
MSGWLMFAPLLCGLGLSHRRTGVWHADAVVDRGEGAVLTVPQSERAVQQIRTTSALTKPRIFATITASYLGILRQPPAHTRRHPRIHPASGHG